MLLGRSIELASIVTVAALALGAPLGVLIARTSLVGRRWLWAVHAFPFFLPPFLLALGWFETLGRGGPLGTELTSRALFGEIGVVAILALAFAPIASSLTILGLLGLDASLEEAARVSARPWRVVTRILLPSVRPALVLAGLVIFAFAVSELGVPMFLRVDVLPAAVFARLGGLSYAPGEAFALAIPLIPLALALMLLERRFAGARSFAVAGLRGMARSPLDLGKWRGACAVFAWVVAALGCVPIGALVLRAAADGGFHGLSSWLGQAPVTSATVAFAGAATIGALSIVLGHALVRRARGAAVLDALATLAFLTPAGVLGAGLIAVWGAPATRFIYGSVAILVVGYVARYTAVGVRAVSAVLAQSPVQLEEAAAAAGAGYWRRLTRIVVPANARGIVGVALLAMALCLRDFETAVLYYPPGREPLTVRIFTLEANGAPGTVAALASVHVLLTAVLCAVGVGLLWRRASP